jgi:hypothetical protein
MADEKPADAPTDVSTDVSTDAPTEEPEEMMREVHEDGCHVAWTRTDIDVLATMDQVRSNQAGAIVIFSGDPSKPLLKLPTANTWTQELHVITPLADKWMDLYTTPTMSLF